MRKLKHSKALSLVEVMVAVFVSSLVAIMVVSLLNTGNRTFFQVSKTSDLQNESNLLFSIIERDLARSGFVHPLRGDVTNIENCLAIIAPENAVAIVSGTEVSSCFDRPGFNDENVLRYKITYAQGPIGIVAEASDPNTLYKKVERTNDCNTIITDLDTEETAITHGWQPVSDNIGSINFSYPTIGGEVNDHILDVHILFQTRGTPVYSLPFRKRVYLKNTSIDSSSGLCDNRCPNTKYLFTDYDLSENTAFWDPTVKNIPSARVVIQTGLTPGEDKLKWDTQKATDYGLTVIFSDVTGVLKIDGSTTGTNYEDFIQSINYVNTQPLIARTANEDPNRIIILALGDNDCSPIGRKVGTIIHFYCYFEATDGAHGGAYSDLDNGWLWWGEAKIEAEAKTLFDLKGYLANIQNLEENNYILNKLRKQDASDGDPPPSAWFGGTDAELDDGAISYEENLWRWSGGPGKYADVDDFGNPIFVYVEEDVNFYTDDNTPPPGSFPPWENVAEPGDPADNTPDNNSDFVVDCDSIELQELEHCQDGGGEHYTLFKSDGDWADLALSGNSEIPYQTEGYIIEYSTDFNIGDACDTADNKACVNFFDVAELVLKDDEFQDVDMLDFCDTNP